MTRTNQQHSFENGQDRKANTPSLLNAIIRMVRRDKRRSGAIHRNSAPAETLETRQLLSAVNFIGDPDDQISEVASFGQLSAAVTNRAGSISQATDVDLFAFEATQGQVISTIVTSQSGLQPYLRLFGPTGFSQHPGVEPLGSAFDGSVLTMTAPATGTYYVGISELSNTFYNVRTGGSDFVDTRATTGAYNVLIADTGDAGNNGGGSTAKADLVGTFFNVIQEPLSPGQAFDLDYDISNDGTASAGSTTVEFYASTDRNITNTDTFLGRRSVPAISADGTYKAPTTRLVLPQTFSDSDGEFFVGMIIDATDSVSESNESNNAGQSWLDDYDDIKLNQINASPDLSGGVFDVTQLQVAAGETATVTFSVTNSGDANARNFDIAFYANSGTEISDSDIYLGKTRIIGLAANFTSPRHTVELTLPEDFTDLDNLFRLGMVIDANDEVTESNEANNANSGHAVDWETVKLKMTPTPRPGRPSVTPPSDTQDLRPTIRWSAAEDAESYQLWVTNLQTGQRTILESSIRTTSFRPATNLAAGGYRCWIRAENSTGWGAWSDPQAFTIGVQPLGTTTVDSVDVSSSLRPTITWNADSAASGYDIWLRHLDTGTVVSKQQGLTSASFTPQTNLAGGRYKVWARAFNASGRNSWSSSVNFTIPGGIPGRVTGLSAMADFGVSEFTWTEVTGADRYELWVKDSSTRQRVVHNTSIDGTTFTADTVLNNGQHRMWVRAGNSEGWGSWSAAHSFDANIPEVPAQVQLIEPTATQNARPEVRWVAVEGAETYEVELINSATGGLLLTDSVRGVNSYTTSTDLADGDYDVRVRAVNDAGSGLWSRSATFTVAANASSNAVTFGVSPLDGSSTLVARFSWNAVDNANDYEYLIEGTQDHNRQETTSGTSRRTTSASLNLYAADFQRGEFSLRVRAITDAGPGDWSEPVFFYYSSVYINRDFTYDGWTLGRNT